MGNSRIIQWAVAAAFISMILMEVVVVVSAYEGGVDRYTWSNRFNREFNKNRNPEQGMGRKKWRKRNNRRKKLDTVQYNEEDNNMLFHQRTRQVEENSAVAKPEDLCCPVVFDMIAPDSGRNQNGQLVQLYRDAKVVQRFHEVSCAPDVANKPCKFLDRQYTSHSRCVQQYSYTYALVQPTEGERSAGRHHSVLDHIAVRSGCACEIASNREPQRQKKYKRPKRNQAG